MTRTSAVSDADMCRNKTALGDGDPARSGTETSTALGESKPALSGTKTKTGLGESKTAQNGRKSALSVSKTETALGVSVLAIIRVPDRGKISSQRSVHQFHDSRKNGLVWK